jgi:hypothetical protein
MNPRVLIHAGVTLVAAAALLTPATASADGVARPRVGSVGPRCDGNTSVRRVVLDNTQSTRAVSFGVDAIRPGGRLVREVRVPAGQKRFRDVRARGPRKVVRVEVHVTRQVWRLGVVRGAGCV